MFTNYGQISETELQEWISEKEMNLVYLVDKETSSISVSDLEMHYYINYKFYVFLQSKIKNQWFTLEDTSGESPMFGLVYSSSQPIDNKVLSELRGYVKKYVEPIHNN